VKQNTIILLFGRHEGSATLASIVVGPLSLRARFVRDESARKQSGPPKSDPQFYAAQRYSRFSASTRYTTVNNRRAVATLAGLGPLRAARR